MAVLNLIAWVIRDLKPGTYTTAEIQERYNELAERHGALPEDMRQIGRALGSLGCGHARVGREAAWFINVEGIRRRWPSLPWSE